MIFSPEVEFQYPTQVFFLHYFTLTTFIVTFKVYFRFILPGITNITSQEESIRKFENMQIVINKKNLFNGLAYSINDFRTAYDVSLHFTAA